MPAFRASPWPAHLGLLLVLYMFCAPLFLGLDRWDLDNDEAIYSYAIDRMLETGDWLTPRLIPYDGPFLEKPPLKFWMVAAAMRAGVLPRDEFGLRFTDAVFGSMAFVYVFLLGRRLAGPLCGWAAVLILFTLDPLLFEHGLRSNNMEAPLVLAFCGGMYHFARWIDESPAPAFARSELRRGKEAGHYVRRSSWHALAVALYFTLGFMTKFVAALFLPLVCAVALAWRRDAVALVRSRWREWRLPLIGVAAITLPWFIYQAASQGTALWETMVERHVYERFTAALDPRHLRPWNFYYSQMWLELILAGSHWIGAFGAVMLAVRAWQGDVWLWRLLVVWLMLPIVVLSFGTSKVFYYTYPFLPALALGGGAVIDAMFRAMQRRLSPGAPAPPRPPARLPAWIAPLALAAAVIMLAMAGTTALRGPIEWELGDVRVLRNSSVVRPLVAALVALFLGGYLRLAYLRAAAMRAIAFAVVAVVLPVLAYPRILERTDSERYPIRSLRDCVTSLGSRHATHVFMPYDDLLYHGYYYYLRGVGPWLAHRSARAIDMREALAAEPRPFLLLSRGQYTTLTREVGSFAGVTLSARDPVVVVTAGALAACTPGAVAAGASAVGPRVQG